jgi:hypothetical protein
MLKSGQPTAENKKNELKLPKKSDGSKDLRYKHAQYIKSDGSRDMRTNLVSKK